MNFINIDFLKITYQYYTIEMFSQTSSTAFKAQQPKVK